ncbi:MAG: tetratricopeptide repeat protein [Candidatus Latescibacteria bacterium]|nr:tetratricopeptide repeat protein [Candidatus Latescibacterota bacterium]MBT4137777.1 tetratricopeptide repeat protein [Candidatus Latescibacterota bacterium]MBT5830259.1 tetratricopeptide repeat protein [Candidatus Latescibacterota bacterium]
MKTLLILICLYIAPLGAQTIQPHQINTEMQKARTFETQNDLANALRIYANLYAQYPARGDVVLRLENIYSRTGQHAKIVPLLKQHLKQSPNDIITHLKLGDALFILEKKDEAFTQWEHLLKNATTPHVFRLVAEKYIKNSVYDRANTVYRQARLILNLPDLFAKELAELAERQTHYTEAIQEYLIFVRIKPQYRTMIEARLRDIAKNTEQHNEIFDLLATEVRKFPTNRNYLGLLIEYALPASLSTQALRIVQNTPNLPANSWTYLSRIAQYALGQSNFETATEAYQALYDHIDRPDVRARALIGLAHTHEKSQQTNSARHYYQAVIDQFPTRPEADEARFYTGLFLRDLDHKRNAAQKVFQELLNTNRKNKWRYRAFFELAESYLQTDQFEKAQNTWTRILAERKIGPEAAQARYCLAESHYYTGNFQAAKVMLNLILTKDLGQNVANDAIAKLALIEEGENKDLEQLKHYAQVELILRQQKLKDAHTAFEELQKQHPQTFLADRILYQQATVLEELKRYTEAIQHHRKLILTQTESPLCPPSQMALAQIYETRLRQYHEAKQAYETLLVRYPISFEADLARERLRLLQDKIQAIETPKETG